MRTFDGIPVKEVKQKNLNHHNKTLQSVEFLICEIIENYYRWSDSIKMRNGKDGDYRDVQAEEFKNGITYKENNKYT